MPQVATPEFSVRKLNGTITRKYFKYNAKTGQREEYEKEQPAGFLVTTYRGDQIRVFNEEGLQQLGLNRRPRIISKDGDEDGEVVERNLELGVRSRNMVKGDIDTLESLMEGLDE